MLTSIDQSYINCVNSYCIEMGSVDTGSVNNSSKVENPLKEIINTKQHGSRNKKYTGLIKDKISKYNKAAVSRKNENKISKTNPKSTLRCLIADLVSADNSRLKSVSFNKLLFNTTGVGDVVARTTLPEDFPDIKPAQEAVIPYVLEQKKHYLNGSTKPIIIDVWQNPKDKALYIQDGQHRFVAACLLGKQIILRLKKIGFPAFNGSWDQTRYIDTLAAKDRIKP
ncbi:ParB N-terminal domain-containing protein [Spartinivicinus ruber]|uniref:hypothetical protein n=1 Tax=Spartinivicinus ruber TaxID=2683272 RepID=UPI0013D0AFF1|nr:hypothetical protein [Spartinivicinus ruber]